MPGHHRNRSFVLGLGALALMVAGCASQANAAPPVSATVENAAEEVVRIESPNGDLELAVSSMDGQPVYEITYKGEQVVSPSRLGLRFDTGPDLDTGFEIGGVESASVDTTWQQPWGERRTVTDRHNEVAVSFTGSSPATGYILRVRVFDEGIGFRYEVPDGGVRAIIDEITEFNVEADATAWWTPAGEFNRLEYTYRTTPVSTVERAHTPFTLRTESGVHMAIHEAALVDYAGMWLDQRRAGQLEAELAPRHDGVKVRVDGAFNTPWRAIQIAADAPGLVNGTDLYLNLNEPNRLGDVSYFEPGKYIGIWWGMHIGTYTWGSGPIHGATNENTKRYIDFAAENGFTGVLVEGWNIGWDGDWFNNGDLFSFTETYPDFDLPSLSAYAEARGVSLIGHHETSGNITNYENQMEAGFDLYAANGIDVVKTGYVADASDLKFVDEDGHARYTWHASQERVTHDIRVLEAAHKRGIAINAHEPLKDTGLRRTYPNAVSREGARGMEFNAWGSPPNTVEHQAILPFTRLLSGPFDFTPGIFDLMPHGPDDQNRVPSTLAKQLALYVTIYSPVQMAADLPENYARYPDAFQFIRDVPADWEESIALAGEVGDYFAIARQGRNSQDWFIGAVTDEAARSVSVDLDFLVPGRSYTAEIYRDGEAADWKSNPYDYVIESQTVTSESALELAMAPGGGIAIRLTPHETEEANLTPDWTPSKTAALPSGATLMTYDSVSSEHVAPREVQIWLPPGYDDSEARYPVIYMHDGQNLFERGRSYTGDSWEVDATLGRLIADGEVQPAIVVGMASTETRWQDYAPASVISALPTSLREAIQTSAGGEPVSDGYLKFIVDEVKPEIDARYRTRPDAAHTSIAGASMGGLISLYAISEYPDTFSAAAGLSTHWPLHAPDIGDVSTKLTALTTALDAGGLNADQHRLWLDYGTENLDAHYGPYQVAMDSYFAGKGFTEHTYTSRLYDGADHNEASWAARLADPFVFLLAAEPHTPGPAG